MTEETFNKLLRQVHVDCNTLCFNAMGEYLPIAGNIGIFCQSNEECKELSKRCADITEVSEDPLQKYFRLKTPIIFTKEGGIPKTAYTHLYIRKYDPSEYGKYLGDVDFVVSSVLLESLIEKITNGSCHETCSIYEYTQKGLTFVEISSPGIASVAYIATDEIAKSMRTK